MFRDMILAGALQMNIAMSENQAEMFALYHKMLISANAQFNLTRVPDDMREAIDRNYLDCLSPLSHGFAPQNAIDVGSGAGFPGIPLAIMCPDTHFTLLDALDKRVKFLQSVVDALHLNATCLHARCEDAAHLPAYRERFDAAVARAVAPMNVLCEYMMPFVRVGGKMIALKGPALDAELKEAKAALSLLGGGDALALDAPVPGRDWMHKIAIVQKTKPTPGKYPRKAGIPERKPL